MAVQFFAEQITKPRLKYRLISKWLKYIIVSYSKEIGNISYIFCGDNYLLEVNKKYLNHDFYTDIITFDYVEGNIISGDIFISTERVEDNSVKFGVNLEDEFLRVISHGVLHLLKYRDHEESEKELMRKIEAECISQYKRLENDGSLQL
jgi:probable rRNA maturation factor